jgi:hypothetical protein
MLDFRLSSNHQGACPMKRLSLSLVVLALVAGCSSSTSPSTPTKPTFTSELRPANEVPPVTNAESGGSGNVTVVFDTTTNSAGAITAASATFIVNASGFPAGTPINAAHIHPGAAGTNGGVLVSTALTPGEVALTNGSGSFTKIVTTVDPAVAQNIINNPAGFYFNIHSTLNPGGVARGQLVRVQ